MQTWSLLAAFAITIMAVVLAAGVLAFAFPGRVVKAWAHLQYKLVVQVRKGRETLPVEYEWSLKLHDENPEDYIRRLKTMMVYPERIPIAITQVRIMAVVLATLAAISLLVITR